MAVAKTVAHPKVVLGANEAPAAKQVLQDAPEIQTHDHLADREQTADPKVALAMKMVHHVGPAWDVDLKGGLAATQDRHAVDLVAPECQVVNEAPTPDQDAGQALIADPKAALATKMVHHVGLEWDDDLKEDLAVTQDRHEVALVAREWPLMIEKEVLSETRARVSNGVANTPAIGCLSMAEAVASSVLVTVHNSDTVSAHKLGVQNIAITRDSVHETVVTVTTVSDRGIVLSSDITSVHRLADLNIGITPDSAHETAGTVITVSDPDIVLSSDITSAHRLADLNIGTMPDSVHETAGADIMGSDRGIVLSSVITLVHRLVVLNIGTMPDSAHETVVTVTTVSARDIVLSSDITLVHRLADLNIGTMPDSAHETVVTDIMGSDRDIVLSSDITSAHKLADLNIGTMPDSVHETAGAVSMGSDRDIVLSSVITLVHRLGVQNIGTTADSAHETVVMVSTVSVQGAARHMVIISAPQTAMVDRTSDRRHGGRNLTGSSDHRRHAVA